ncbi:MAG: hypothetical protein ABIW50_03090, partial [Candidatus Limnocylindria bacterium]
MSEPLALLYLESDDEVTTVVRRIRATDAERIVIVAPGRSRATSSVVAMRLMARSAQESDRELSVVGDSLTRSLAMEAGLSAWASIEDARAASPVAETTPAARAPIRVVRGDVTTESDETAPLAAALAPPARTTDSDETRAVPLPRRPSPGPGPARARRSAPPALLLAALAGLVVAGGVIGAVVLPAATVTIVPRAEPIGPTTYEIRVDQPDRAQGSVAATAVVTATGTYPIQVAATGVVAFRNFNTVDIAVGAGTLVAAGEQAFATTADVVVPAGTLTGEGTIRAGEEAVGVEASAIGPGANVPAEAIDTILSQNVAARLRGFPNNAQRLVLNPEPTSGGVDDTGPEITQEDVDAATAALVAELGSEVDQRLGAADGALVADGLEPSAPRIEGLDGLVGTRDQPTVELSGTLDYDRMTASRDDVIAIAEERAQADPPPVPVGHEVIPSSLTVTLGSATRDGDALLVSVAVNAASTPTIDRARIVATIRGLGEEEART